MSIDMKQFHGVFFEESQEHLQTMEELLLAIDCDAPDAEALNSIFRAAHSIKGGSGIFGFEALTRLTHGLEGLLDEIRQGKISITRQMVDVFLNTVDTLNDILSIYRNDLAIDWDALHKQVGLIEALTERKNHTDKEPCLGYGFFDEQDNSTVTKNNNDVGFGFFDDEPNNTSLIHNTSSINSTHSTPPNDKDSTLIIPRKPASSENIQVSNTKQADAHELSSIRVDVHKVDQLINLVGELVITQSMLNLMGQQLDPALFEKFQAIAAELERNTREIQDAVMSIRMLPISFVFNRFPRVVRDLSGKLGKSIELIIEGGETELDKGLTEKLVDPLTHLVRNSIDHGIESVDLRQAQGKPDIGKLTLSAYQQGGSIVISMSDDGAGLNREKIIKKAQENNIPISDEASDEDIWQLIFSPGFSTAQEVTDVSGRGVGLDVVKKNVASLGGRIDIKSVAHVGTTFTIHLPLTLAIVDGMCVSVADQTFIIPLINIVESMQPIVGDIKKLANKDQLLWVRNEYWPVISLAKEMQLESTYERLEEGIVVLLESGKHRFALFVDGLVGQQQVVIKSLEQHYRRIRGVAGATIMGDGSVALIIDVDSIAKISEKITNKEGCAA